MGYTQAELQEKVALGADSIFRVAPVAVGGALPAAADFKELCLASEVEVGFEGKSITFANFCSRGSDVEIPVGATGKVALSEMQWIKDDPALVIMENAARATAGDPELRNTISGIVAYEFMPEGAGTGKVVYRGTFGVKSWSVKSAAGGTVTVPNPTIAAGGLPEKGTLE